MTRRRRVLMVLASPATHATLGYPVGFWASELTHAWFELNQAGYELTLASPAGGKVEADGYSDPRHESGYSADDLLSLGFLSSPTHAALLEDTRPLSAVRAADHDAIYVAGGQGPMFTFREDPELHRLLREFHEAKKITAAVCHGTAALLDVRLTAGQRLIEGRTMTGFANVEEEAVDQAMGTKVMPFRIEDEARARGARFIHGPAFRPFAIRDENLITGQQQQSARRVAELVIEALGR